MQLDFALLPGRDVYNWMVSTITPRPIAWVSTISPAGVTNLAPFSFFQGITSNPPTLMFVPVNNRSGQPKDTLRNIEATREFVVNLVSHDLAATMSDTAALLGPDESEMDRFNIAGAPSVGIRPPRVAAARVAFECVLHDIVRIGEGAGAANVVFGRIGQVHIADAVLTVEGQIDPAKLDLIGRMGGEGYVTTRDRFTIPRPDRG